MKKQTWQERFNKEFAFRSWNNEPWVNTRAKDLKQFIAIEIIEAQRQAFQEGILARIKGEKKKL